jgi:butyryl-CoA dehydrogenase
VLNGTKIFISNGGRARHLHRHGHDGQEQGGKRHIRFYRRKRFPRFQLGQLEEKLGIRASDTRTYFSRIA